jgi:protein TorT
MKLALKTAAALALATVIPASAFAADWFPYPAEEVTPAFAADGKVSPVTYTPLAKADKPWNICVSFPHMKDAYWLGVDYGVADEAKRLGVKMNLVEAGGYTELNKQISQIEDCVSSGADAVVIGAISYEGLNSVVKEVAAKGIPVIDVINGMSSPDIAAKSLVSFRTMGFETGKYLEASGRFRAGQGRLVPRARGCRLGRGRERGLHGSRQGVGRRGAGTPLW